MLQRLLGIKSPRHPNMTDPYVSHAEAKFIVDFAKVSIRCDSCKETIDNSKPKPKKGPDGKAKPAELNPAIKATLETTVDSGETKDFHFCDERCLLGFLKARYK